MFIRQTLLIQHFVSRFGEHFSLIYGLIPAAQARLPFIFFKNILVFLGFTFIIIVGIALNFATFSSLFVKERQRDLKANY